MCDVVTPENVFLQHWGSDPSGFSSLSKSPPSCQSECVTSVSLCHGNAWRWNLALSGWKLPVATSTKWVNRLFIVCPMTSSFHWRMACSWFPHLHMQVFGSVFLFCVCVLGVKNNKKHSFIMLHRGHLNLPLLSTQSLSRSVSLSPADQYSLMPINYAAEDS